MKKNTVLIADDDPGVRRILERVLSAANRSVVAVETGPAAVEAAVAHRPSLIILDVMMPGLDGRQVCAALRADSRTWDIPILMVTGLCAVADEVGGLDAGADDYVAKPFHTADLTARVDALLRRAARSRE